MKQHDVNSPCVSTPQGGEQKVMTKAEVLAAREAFKAGGLWRHSQFLIGRGPGVVNDDEYARAAEKKYPMPKKTVPREVETSTGTKYRVRDGRVEWKQRGSYHWTPTKYVLDDYALVASLKDNPTCEVEV